MRLYHHPMSSNSRRATMTALHVGASPELVYVDLSKGAQHEPAYRELNPNAKVPVLVDGDLTLWESHAIMQYLADVRIAAGDARAKSVYPTELQARADVNRWLFWSAYHFTPAISVLGWERVVKPMIGRGDPDPKEEARGEALVRELANVLDAHLEGKEWVAQGRVTLADFALATPLAFAKPARLPLEGKKHLDAWFTRVQGLEAWRATEPRPKA